MIPLPVTGRCYVGWRSVRLGDIDPSGRLRFDAIARYCQDVANDDSHDADLENANSWVVRRMAVEVHSPPEFREELELSTFCSGIGRRWAERRTSIRGSEGGLVEVSALWVHLDPRTGAPLRFGEQFFTLYGEAAQGRAVSSRLQHDEAVATTATRVPWSVRRADLDILGHVNNAVYWAAIEEWLSGRDRTGIRADVEYRRPLEYGSDVELAWLDRGPTTDLWISGEAATYATARTSLIA